MADEKTEDQHDDIEMKASENRVELHVKFPYLDKSFGRTLWPARVILRTPQQAREMANKLLKYADVAEALQANAVDCEASVKGEDHG